jgi:GT2 family glycosyltransferase
MPAPLVSVSIASFNTRALLRECLRSLEERRAEAGIEIEIIVVDNGSRDGSVEMVREEFPQVLVIEAGRNLGYGAANNLALREARGEFVWVLNSDTTIEPDTIAAMIRWMRERPECGAIGPRLILPDGSTQSTSCARDPSLWAVFCEQTFLDKLLFGGRYSGSYAPSNWSFDEPREAPQLCGASLFVRREAWLSAGGFDESYFMYMEDADLCVRLREAGWSLWYLPPARVRHHLGASSQAAWRERARMVFHYNLGRLIFFSRSRGRTVAHVLRLVLSLGALARLLVWSALSLRPRATRTQRAHAREQMRLFRAVWNATRCAPTHFEKAREVQAT